MASSNDANGTTSPAQVAGGFSVLDGVALVIGATMASIHLRHLVQTQDLNGFGWGVIWITFAGIAVSASGPFLFLTRRYLRRVPGYPGVGDRLWAMLGVPWVAAALVRSSRLVIVGGDGRSRLVPGEIDSYIACLWLVQAFVCLVVLIVVWKTWVLATPEEIRAREPVPWTDRMGMALAVAWPLQWGFSLVAVG